jgi:hypothetical protein
VTKAVNHHYFDELNERSAWMLGFWAADGSIVTQRNYHSVTFTQKDVDVLRMVQRELGSEHKLLKGRAHTLRFTSDVMYQSLCDIFGVDDLHRKSRILKWPKHLPEHLFWHFMRGWIDGDGCYAAYEKDSVYRLAISSSSRAILNTAKAKIAERTGVECNDGQTAETVFVIHCAGINAKILIHHLYDGATIWIPRKKQMADAIMGLKLGQVPRNLSDKTVELYPDLIANSLDHGSSRSTSGYYGVKRAKGKWAARIGMKHLKYYDDPKEAALHHDRAAREAFGPRAVLNFA